MNGWEVFQIYQPIHLHFTTKYDLFKYGKKTKSVSFDSYNKRKDKQVFESLARKATTKEEVGGLCVANFLQSDDWIYKEIKDSWVVYIEWKSIRSNLRENVNHDLDVLSKIVEAKKVESFSDLFRAKSGKLPPLLQLYQTKRVISETVCYLDTKHDFLLSWIDIIRNDPLAASNVFKLMKYKPFINYSKLED